ncbi:MAG: hypothetical protein JNM82_16960, partial [Rhodocyclaceae bacterium]|nr:hypothetical protein [Rhodocyclaceae bacterium]
MNVKPRLVVLGSGAAARMVGGMVLAADAFELAGFTDANAARHGELLCGRPILGDDGILPDLRRQGVSHAVVAAGEPRLRRRLGALLRAEGFELASVVHPHAYLAPEVRLGQGVIVLPGTVMMDNPVIGDNVFVGQSVAIGHDVVVGDDCLVGGRAALGADVIVGAATLLGWASI